MKATISRLSNGQWRLLYYVPSPIGQGLMAVPIKYLFAEGAFEAWRKIESKVFRQQKAYAMVQQINRRLLSVPEDDFIQKCQRTKCKHITKRQYGWIRGLYDRTRL